MTDEEIVPDSIYEIQSIGEGQEVCGDRTEAMFTAPLTVRTGRWGDVATCFESPLCPGQPYGTDVQSMVDTFKHVPGSPSNVFAKLYPSVLDPGGPVDAIDITLVVDAFKGLPYPLSPTFCPCVDEADIRADLNGDGHINADDNALEATQALYFVVNSDDDNGNGIEDSLDDGPVEGEDDLVEIRLSARCPPLNKATAWWSISWEELNPGDPALRVWSTLDKSDGQGGIGTSLMNGLPYVSWPPPSSIWVESPHPSPEVELTLVTLDNSVGVSNNFREQPDRTVHVAGGGCCKEDKVKLASSCAQGNHWAHAVRTSTSYGIYGASADISTCTTLLCGEPNASAYASSNAWVSVGRGDMWAQHGYAHDRESGSESTDFRRYTEINTGPGLTLPDYNISFYYPVDPGPHEYRVELDLGLGRWRYYYDGIELASSHSSTWSRWVGLTGDRAVWAGEIHNRDDQMVGTTATKCRFRYCSIQNNAGLFIGAGLVSSELWLESEPPTGPLDPPDATQWGIELANPQGIPPTSSDVDIWDKVP